MVRRPRIFHHFRKWQQRRDVHERCSAANNSSMRSFRNRPNIITRSSSHPDQTRGTGDTSANTQGFGDMRAKRMLLWQKHHYKAEQGKLEAYPIPLGSCDGFALRLSSSVVCRMPSTIGLNTATCRVSLRRVCVSPVSRMTGCPASYSSSPVTDGVPDVGEGLAPSKKISALIRHAKLFGPHAVEAGAPAGAGENAWRVVIMLYRSHGFCLRKAGVAEKHWATAT
nr:hypothetical protein CFP56_39000 [Quercus suber]